MLSLFGSVVLAAQQPTATVSVEAGTVLLSVIGSIFMILITVIGYLAVRTITQIDTNQIKLFSMIDALTKSYYKLEGEHEVFHGHRECK